MRLMPRKQVLRFAQDLGCGLTPARRLDLLNTYPASTLLVFQSTEWLVLRNFRTRDEEGTWAGCIRVVFSTQLRW